MSRSGSITSPILYQSTVYIFLSLTDHWAHCGIFENGVLLMYTLEGISSITNFISAYDESLSIKPRLTFSICDVFYVSKSNFSLLVQTSMFYKINGQSHCAYKKGLPQLAFYVNLHRAVIDPSATLTGRWRPDIDLRRMLTGTVLCKRIHDIEIMCLDC